MSLVSRLKRPKSCFSSHLCFLVIVVPLVLVSLVFVSGGCDLFLCAFGCSLRVVVSMCQRCFQRWQVLFLPLSLTHIMSFWEVMPYAWLLVFLFSSPFVQVLLWYTSRMIPSILRKGQPRYLCFWQTSCYVVFSRVIFWFFSNRADWADWSDRV